MNAEGDHVAIAHQRGGLLGDRAFEQGKPGAVDGQRPRGALEQRRRTLGDRGADRGKRARCEQELHVAHPFLVFVQHVLRPSARSG